MKPAEPSIAKLAIRSAGRFVRLATSGSLRRRRDRLGECCTIAQGGAYAIFRETVSERIDTQDTVVLIVGFRLRWLRANRYLHWAFQRVCILTTPFWSGFPGFHIKLWMVDPQTKSYLGIYEWMGEAKATTYVNALLRVLRPISTPNSVWRELIPNQGLDAYLASRRA